MPIRTNRGRTAVYRRLWGWPLRSPRHLVATVVGLIALVATTSIVFDHTVGSKSGAAPGATTTSGRPTTIGGGNQIGVLPPAGTTTALPTKAPSPTAAASSAPVTADAQLVAESWIDAWLNHPAGTTNAKWLGGLKPWTSDELLPTLQSVDPANVPKEIKSPVKAVRPTTDSVDFEADLETGKLVLTVAKLPEGWRVHKYSRVG
ncbi:hypothetical protein ABZ816_36565 [Actinosynnema sp. NPDC047251]|uniref:Uncharacterized protein n=1 Tax=Saccharothrix espanaensis (strain ATCC 51144 / DSM 44229 / JCM 9112 / NBRC 15066 / NRRL 15764) TaxID=1179773 RepID=K0JU08_SACES|nr:hypothetical protein [Saccharothrix espanaensis]CCH28304.1 hypothetical protein BN6_09750 [Saccharothrix espanaensis DSM 44229]